MRIKLALNCSGSIAANTRAKVFLLGMPFLKGKYFIKKPKMVQEREWFCASVILTG
jgi:hypothetical protein